MADPDTVQCQPKHYRPHSAAHTRPTGPSSAGQPRPPAAHDVAMPPQVVAGVTISRIAAKRPTGIVPAARASHARSGHVNLE